ncbi:hypothetical protein GCM10022223_25790 [Kineosporia mesophila]|uniref:Uncharacterized protein n=1 Tax=Kineosporia mesophila TaxID=566012 RepID=A0ABP6ZG28_9ACTN
MDEAFMAGRVVRRLVVARLVVARWVVARWVAPRWVTQVIARERIVGPDFRRSGLPGAGTHEIWSRNPRDLERIVGLRISGQSIRGPADLRIGDLRPDIGRAL